MLFRGFDFGKSLLKQIESYKRLSANQQARRTPAIQKYLEGYTKKFLAMVNNPGAANPGQLKNAAEALVDASIALQDAGIAYSVFSELVARSRKVPVVPGLAGLVDRLLTLPTELKEERCAMLNWRITTGNLRPERYLSYLSQRAQLTGESSDWKDYSWGLSNLLKKGSVRLEDELVAKTLETLLKNRMNLGDRAMQTQMLAAELLIKKKNTRQAETLLVEIAKDAKQLPEEFVELVHQLLDARSGASWELHQIALAPALSSYDEDKASWNAVKSQLRKAQAHASELLEYLLAYDRMPHDKQLALYALEEILALPAEQLADPLDRWHAAFEHAGLNVPDEAHDLISGAAKTGRVPEQVAEEASTASLTQHLVECTNAAEIQSTLAEFYPPDSLDSQAAGLLCEAVADSDIPVWAGAEARLWAAKHLLAAGEVDAAENCLMGLPLTDPDTARDLLSRIREMTGPDVPAKLRITQARIALAANEYDQALAETEAVPEDDPSRAELFTEIIDVLHTLHEPTPAVKMTLARAQRASMPDPEAGFEAATTASLLAPEDGGIQEQYKTWLSALSAEIVHIRRAAQASYICAHEQKLELLPIAITEIEELAEIEAVVPSEVLNWLELLRPFLDEVDAEHEAVLRTRWTRLHLMYVIKAGERERIPEAIQAATAEMEHDAALLLVRELGEEIPVAARRMFEYETLIRQGEWENALALLAEGEGVEITGSFPIQVLCRNLADEALLPASERLTRIYAERGDNAQQLELIKCLESHVSNGGDDTEVRQQLRELTVQLLSELCEQEYSPAVRHRLEMSKEGGDFAAYVKSLLALSREGDTEVAPELEQVYSRLLEEKTETKLLTEVATELATAVATESPQRAFSVLAEAGLSANVAEWALAQVQQLNLVPQDTKQQIQLAQLSLSQGNTDQALVVVEQLIADQQHAMACELAEKLAEQQPDVDKARVALIRAQLGCDPPSFKAATRNLLKLALLYQQRELRLAEALDPLLPELERAISQNPEDVDAPYLNLVTTALTGQHERAAETVQEMMQQDVEDASALLKMFDRLAMEDAELPTPLVLCWARALVFAERAEDALQRLSGLRDAVGDYPEYIALLEEIKESGGGPGASMQLGEAYLRVHLWQRSAEEYSTALDQDSSLAEPIITQLRHHGALDPNPMKYPLHLVGLRAVVESQRAADWGWALSALNWLLPRWSAEELYELAKRLQNSTQQPELEEEQRSELLAHLFRLASKLGQAVEALEFLGQAWSLTEQPTPELIAALRDFNRSALPDDPALMLKLQSYELEAAVAEEDESKIIQAAEQLAKVSPDGRERALVILKQHQERASDPLPVLLLRLRLLDLSTETGRETFVRELMARIEADLPSEHVRSLIGTVLEMLDANPENPDLVRLLLKLFLHLGDEARAWQLALSAFQGSGEPVTSALEVIDELASGEYALNQKVVAAEIRLLRGEYEQAIRILLSFEEEQIAQAGAITTSLGEALLDKAPAKARPWLVSAYKGQELLELAADHCLWSHADKQPFPCEWLAREQSGELLYRAALLAELEQDINRARKIYEQGHQAKTDSVYIRATICSRLAFLAQESNDLPMALEYAQEAARLVTASPRLEQHVTGLQQIIRQNQIQQAREQVDSPMRTLEIARLHQACGAIDEAVSELQAGMGRGQTNPELFVELGECFNENSEFGLARRAFNEVLARLEAGEGDFELKLRTLYGLALAEEYLGNVREAIRFLEGLLVLKHGYGDSRERLNRLREETKKKTKPGEVKPKQAEPTDKIISEILSLLKPASEEEPEDV